VRRNLVALCRRYGMRRPELFGSVLRSDFDAQNGDVDVVVEFGTIPQADSLRQYFDFKPKLQGILHRPVDLVELAAMEDTRPKRIIERTKVPVYAAA
jgi:predicted nucleotidyltransferase